MFGFGKGPMKYFNNTPEVAFSKTLAQTVRGGFWMFGWPIGVLPILFARGRRALSLALFPLVVVAGYFLYYANAVSDTGPVYYLCTLPVIAVLAVHGLATLARRFPRVELASLGGLVLASACFFMPRELVAARDVARLVRRPKRAVEQARIHNAFVLTAGTQPKGERPASWVFFPPIPAPPFEDEDVIWVSDIPARLQLLTETYPRRAFYRLRWDNGVPVVEPTDREP
jgi:hypothetical protein